MTVITLKPPRQEMVASRGFAESYGFWLDDAFSIPDPDMAELSATLTLLKLGLPAESAIVLSTDAGQLTIADNIVTATVAPADTADWLEGDYKFALSVFAAGQPDRYTLISDSLTHFKVHPAPGT